MQTSIINQDPCKIRPVGRSGEVTTITETFIVLLFFSSTPPIKKKKNLLVWESYICWRTCSQFPIADHMAWA
ncbi:hypothetical protein XELAEV_18030059mg [Xenopus laevis]|uniref:Uncharacterized protein n=1 Tax=Xenopus laevis TaxID=8355 RepID=A0A974CUI6_XENLA|nr:hypothetical protein XELAEV_18030059mg [Xenopus laevis]